MKQKIILFILYVGLTIAAEAQESVLHGLVKGSMTEDGKEQVMPVQYASIYWLGTTYGVTTDASGAFAIKHSLHGPGKLVISFVGFENDTILVDEQEKQVEVLLSSARQIKEVTIVKRMGGSYISTIQPIKAEVITSDGLQKLACCNLSESFENSATIDVNYTDAVTGAKQIQMLGLAGIYSQLLMENIPLIRGLSTPYGLTHVPGPWMESIQISKGTSSVINGYESITGQINIEMRKPETAPPLFVNIYGSDEGRLEANLNSAVKLGEKWSMMVLTHASMLENRMDQNGDGFLDRPIGKQLNLMNRWSYQTARFHSQFGIQVLDDHLQAGQTAYYSESAGRDTLYGTDVATRRYQLFAKNGYAFKRPVTSLGVITYWSGYNQQAIFGHNAYDSKQNSLYANAIFQTYLGNTKNTVSTGLSMTGDDYRESLNDSAFNRHEWVEGAFFQYTYTNPEKLTVILGTRADYNNLYGFLFTPRVHLKYTLAKNTTMRASVGKGYRSSNLLADNIGYLASSRKLVFSANDRIEKAWNYGINFTQGVNFKGNRKITFSLDLYHTRFLDQLIADADWNVREVHFYNLSGKSYATSFQAEVIAQPLEGFEFTTAFRFNDAKTQYAGGLLQKPLVSRYKGLVSMSYATRFEKWKFDLTGLLNGEIRLPSTSANPVEYQRGTYSPSYFIIHAQVTRRFKHFDTYVGSENLTGYKQKNPIIAANDPFGPFFDSSMIWGPISGRMIYAGLRYTLK